MNRWGAALLGAACAACGSGSGAGSNGDIGNSAVNDTEIQTYARTFAFDSPVPCSIFVVQRIVDGNAAEYDARASVTGDTIQATYSVVPSDAYPVHLDVSHGP
jgi:hypothetical protein